MGAVFAATARAPITAVLIIFELTGDYAVIPPLMIAVVVATGVANRITEDTIYTLKLRRRGIDTDAPRPGDPMRDLTVGDAMRPVPPPLSLDSPIAEVTERLTNGPHTALPVVGADGALRGVVSIQELEQAIADDADVKVAADALHAAPELRVIEPLTAAVRALARAGEEGLPVLALGGAEVVGWISHRDVLAAYLRRSDPTPSGIPAGAPSRPPREGEAAGDRETPQDVLAP
jgi:CIC family chloride channel protein